MENAEPVQVRLRDQRSIICECKMDVRTMHHEVGSWKVAFFHGPIFFNQSTKLLSPSPSVNQMWSKHNDYVTKSECVCVFF